MGSASGGSEREVEVAVSITCQGEGRQADAALQAWRREVLKEERDQVDLDQRLLSDEIQEWAAKHGSEKRAIAKGRRVTIQGGQIVQGAQRNPPVKVSRVDPIPSYSYWTLAVRNFKPVYKAGKPRLVFGEEGEAEFYAGADDDDGDMGGEGDGLSGQLFTEGDDHQIWATCQKHGTDSAVTRTLARLLLHEGDDADPSEKEEKLIKNRYKWLQTAPPPRIAKHLGGLTFGGLRQAQLGCEAPTETEEAGWAEDDSLAGTAAPSIEWEPCDIEKGLDTFERIFCRRCYVHDCHLHGTKGGDAPCLDPVANQKPAVAAPSTGLEMTQPCSRTCHLLAQDNAHEARDEFEPREAGTAEPEMATPMEVEGRAGTDMGGPAIASAASREEGGGAHPDGGRSERGAGSTYGDGSANSGVGQGQGDREPLAADPSNAPAPDPLGWTPFQVDLFEKGLRIFGMHGSCCRVARLLRGLRTCTEVAERMRTVPSKAEAEQTPVADTTTTAARKKRKRFKYNKRVSVLNVFARKRSAAASNAKNARVTLPAYTPCACIDGCSMGPQSQCPCAQSATPCEKFCACPGTCMLRFGCKCTSRCGQRTCPCFAAQRECDPDVCQGCMVSCGHPSGHPLALSSDGSDPNPHRPGNSLVRLDRCQNMRLQQRRHKKILLGPSAVAGWGAFVCGAAAAGELLGEYTGELLNDAEAEACGKVYDANNKSFLFKLNEQFTLDACHKGDKLKFANHMPNANCEPRVVSVLGDHRVAIHVGKRHLDSGEEIFYDYGYSKQQAPDWAWTDADQKQRELDAQEPRKAAKKGTKK